MKKIAIALTLIGAVCAAPANATLQTLSGSSFSMTYDDAALGLFGTPTLVGNTIKWFPSGSPGFSAGSDGDGLHTTSSVFSMTLTANSGYQLAGFGLSEGGDYYFFGDGAGVNVSGALSVTPLAGGTQVGGIAPTTTFTANSLFDFMTHDWVGGAALSLLPPATKADVSIRNVLTADALLGDWTSSSFIEKKDVTLNVRTTKVPEPSSYMLMMAGLAGLLAARARRRA